MVDWLIGLFIRRADAEKHMRKEGGEFEENFGISKKCMSYFRERHGLLNEYSGFQDASPGLRKRLSRACFAYIDVREFPNYSSETNFVSYSTLQHELSMNLNKSDLKFIFDDGTYDEVFEAVEIFSDVVRDTITYSNRQEQIITEVRRAFDLSGSVYFLNSKGEIELRVDESLAEGLQEAQLILSDHKDASDLFSDTVGGLMSRNKQSKDVVGDLFIAFEDYLKEVTKTSGFDQAITQLERSDIIDGRQKGLIEKVRAYRSDAYAVAHAGNAPEPKEIDALWFLETVIAQLKMIDRKVNPKIVFSNSRE